MDDHAGMVSRNPFGFIQQLKWTKNIYLLVGVMSLACCKGSNYQLQISSGRSPQQQQRQEFVSARRVAALQVPPASSNNDCGAGYVLDLNDNCVKRFVSTAKD